MRRAARPAAFFPATTMPQSSPKSSRRPAAPNRPKDRAPGRSKRPPVAVETRTESRSAGFMITPRMIATAVTTLTLLVGLWKPIQAVAKLPDAIDHLAEAVVELKTLYTSLDKRMGTNEADLAAIKATVAERNTLLQNHETRIGSLETSHGAR